MLLMQTPYGVSIRSAPAKLIFLTSCLFAYLIFTYYTSELTAGIIQLEPIEILIFITVYS